MTRNIKQMITMKTSKFLTVAGACAGLALAGCATTGGAKSGKEPLPDELGGAAVTERETISNAGADQLCCDFRLEVGEGEDKIRLERKDLRNVSGREG